MSKTTKELQEKIAELDNQVENLTAQANSLASQSLAVEVTLRRELDEYRQKEMDEMVARLEHYASLNQGQDPVVEEAR